MISSLDRACGARRNDGVEASTYIFMRSDSLWQLSDVAPDVEHGGWG